MISVDLLMQYFGLNHRIVKQQTEGLTHQDSLLQPPVRGNCLNWVLGHIVANRDQALAFLGQPPIWPDETAALYKTDSEPITPDSQALPLETILADLARSQERLLAALEQLQPADLAAPAGDLSLGDMLTGFMWHEAYHVGQTELLRQLTGTDDKVI